MGTRYSNQPIDNIELPSSKVLRKSQVSGLISTLNGQMHQLSILSKRIKNYVEARREFRTLIKDNTLTLEGITKNQLLLQQKNNTLYHLQKEYECTSKLKFKERKLKRSEIDKIKNEILDHRIYQEQLEELHALRNARIESIYNCMSALNIEKTTREYLTLIKEYNRNIEKLNRVTNSTLPSRSTNVFTSNTSYITVSSEAENE